MMAVAPGWVYGLDPQTYQDSQYCLQWSHASIVAPVPSPSILMPYYMHTVVFWLRLARSCVCVGSGWQMNICATFLPYIGRAAPQTLCNTSYVLYVSFLDRYIQLPTRPTSLWPLMSKPFQPFHNPQRPEKPSPHDKREPLPRRRKTGEALDSTADGVGSSGGTGLREPLPRLRGRSLVDDDTCSAPSRSPLPRLRAQTTSTTAGSSTDGASPSKKPRQKSRPQPKRTQPQLHPPTRAVDLNKVHIIKQPDEPTKTSRTYADEFDETSDEDKVDGARADVEVEASPSAADPTLGAYRAAKPKFRPRPVPPKGSQQARDLKTRATLEIRKATSKAKQRKIRGSLRECLRLQPSTRSTRRVKTTGSTSKAGPRIPPAEFLPEHAGAFDRLEGGSEPCSGHLSRLDCRHQHSSVEYGRRAPA